MRDKSLDLNTSQSERCVLNCPVVASSTQIGGSCADYNVMPLLEKLGSKVAP